LGSLGNDELSLKSRKRLSPKSDNSLPNSINSMLGRLFERKKPHSKKKELMARIAVHRTAVFSLLCFILVLIRHLPNKAEVSMYVVYDKVHLVPILNKTASTDDNPVYYNSIGASSNIISSKAFLLLLSGLFFDQMSHLGQRIVVAGLLVAIGASNIFFIHIKYIKEDGSEFVEWDTWSYAFKFSSIFRVFTEKFLTYILLSTISNWWSKKSFPLAVAFFFFAPLVNTYIKGIVDCNGNHYDPQCMQTDARVSWFITILVFLTAILSYFSFPYNPLDYGFALNEISMTLVEHAGEEKAIDVEVYMMNYVFNSMAQRRQKEFNDLQDTSISQKTVSHDLKLT
jgi:hypothetical protein